jgi:hypothetical protein
MMGKTTPPMLDPVNMTPKAMPRFLLNHPTAQFKAGNENG